MAIKECILGAKNQERIVALERDMGKVSKMIFWLVTSSFMTMVTVITTLVFLVLNK